MILTAFKASLPSEVCDIASGGIVVSDQSVLLAERLSPATMQHLDLASGLHGP